jgi:Uma2 family endonuclease
MAVTKPAGAWTYEDLFDLPDDKRYEIIDGELYEMPPPNSDHGDAIMGLIRLLLPVADRRGAVRSTAPQGVFMPGADPVEPDIFLLLPEQRHLIGKRGVEGAPALVVEVLSPSNPRHDRGRKRALYARGGVREYWLVDPEAATIEVLTLEGDDYRTHLLAGGDERVTSPLLSEPAFPASAVFR